MERTGAPRVSRCSLAVRRLAAANRQMESDDGTGYARRGCGILMEDGLWEQHLFSAGGGSA
jgi:hypothetical protein